MRPRRDVVPYTASTDMRVNASLTIAKLHKRIRLINPNYRPCSRYQSRIKHKRAERLNQRVVR